MISMKKTLSRIYYILNFAQLFQSTEPSAYAIIAKHR